MQIEGSVAFVTGAASGIGQASAVALAEAGASGIAVSDVRPGALEETVARIEETSCEVLALEADAGSVDAGRRCIEAVETRFGRLDVFHANAGVGEGPAGWPGLSAERAAQIVDVNLGGMIVGTLLALPLMQRGGGGAIVATASGAGLAPFAPQAAYAATKAGIVHFVRSCEPLAESHGVRVNCVCPDLTETPMIYESGGGRLADWLQPIADAAELLRPEDIADAVLALVRDDTQIGQAVPVMRPGLGGAE